MNTPGDDSDALNVSPETDVTALLDRFEHPDETRAIKVVFTFKDKPLGRDHIITNGLPVATSFANLEEARAAFRLLAMNGKFEYLANIRTSDRQNDREIRSMAKNILDEFVDSVAGDGQCSVLCTIAMYGGSMYSRLQALVKLRDTHDSNAAFFLKRVAEAERSPDQYRNEEVCRKAAQLYQELTGEKCKTYFD